MEQIIAIREFYGISRRTLRYISGISQDALMRYERGQEMPHKFKLLISCLCNIETFETMFHFSKRFLKNTVIIKIEKKIKEEMIWREREARDCRDKLMTIKPTI